MLPLDATDSSVEESLQPWCGTGQTVALVGSSGVGKTTLLNALTAESSETQEIREDDDKGRHTTTARSMRAMRLHDNADGIDVVFDEITQRAKSCRFADCSHRAEPGCAVRAAIELGELDPERLDRWRILQSEDLRNSQTLAQARQRDKQFGKMVNNATNEKKQRTRR